MISLIGIPIVAIGGYFLVYILAIGNKESFGVGLIGSITFQNLVFAVLMMLDIKNGTPEGYILLYVALAFVCVMVEVYCAKTVLMGDVSVFENRTDYKQRIPTREKTKL
tara:strand:+ start:208 stop:534 length:327 start_codon:yes stop_codon:yes gene_type:complete